MSFLCAFLFLLLEVTLTFGLHIPIRRPSQSYLSPGSPGANPYGFKNHGNMAYTGIVLVNGQPFEVQLDTGSSELWFNTENVTLTGLQETGIPVSIDHQDHSRTSGSVAIGSVTWGNYTIHNQAFVAAPGGTTTRYQGVLGLAPPGNSGVTQELKEHPQYENATFLNNIFHSNPDEPNLITFLLSRNVADVSDGGIFTIGEIVPGFRRIIQSPRLPVVADNIWGTFMDAVIVNGKRIEGGALDQAIVPTPGNKTLVALDTGTATARAPPAYVDAMYSNLPGAQFNGEDGYILPCDTKVNISLEFGGSHYPIHPIDAVAPEGFDQHGNVRCTGTFTYIPNGVGLDFILGDTFLHNVYSLFDYGNWTKGVSSPPYMQLLSVVDPSKAWNEFDSLNTDRLKRFVESPRHPGSPPIRAASAITQSTVTAPSSTPSVGKKPSQMDWSFWLVFGLLGLVVLLFVFLAIDRMYGCLHGRGYKTIEEPQQISNHPMRYSDAEARV